MKRALAMSVCLLVAMPVPVRAQSNDNDYTPLNSRIRRKQKYPLTNVDDWKPAAMNKVNRKRSRAMQGQFSRCIYHRNKTLALKLLGETDYGFVNFLQAGMDTAQASKLFGFDDCLSRVADLNHTGVVMRWSAPALRRWLLDAAYFDRYPKGPDWAKPGYVVDEREYPLSNSNLAVQNQMNFADCVVAANPTTSDYFFRAQSGSEEEQQAEQKLIPALSSCIPKGQQLKLDPKALRDWLGEALWFAANNSYPAPADEAGGAH